MDFNGSWMSYDMLLVCFFEVYSGKDDLKLKCRNFWIEFRWKNLKYKRDKYDMEDLLFVFL